MVKISLSYFSVCRAVKLAKRLNVNILDPITTPPRIYAQLTIVIALWLDPEVPQDIER